MAGRILIKSVTSASSSSSSFFKTPRPSLLSLTTTPLSSRKVAELHVNGHPQDNEVKMDQAEEPYSKEASDFRSKTMRFSETIMPHILNMYASHATPHDFEIYAQDATFEDPLMTAIGIKQIKSAFYSLPKVSNPFLSSLGCIIYLFSAISLLLMMQSFIFSDVPCHLNKSLPCEFTCPDWILQVFKESRMVEYSVEEHEVSPGKHEITIDNKQYYKFLGKDVDMISLIKLYIENGKVIRHEDWYRIFNHSGPPYAFVPSAGDGFCFEWVFPAGGIRSLLGAGRPRKSGCWGESWRLCEGEPCWQLML
ncbi:hypothetical protein SAY86_002143 [Trapa natans]|uniref:Uncharacterized protein n=1 Tax=Trapa natans TaxID=22666 RepID=A0AAN7LIP5_TRANT|nr:hypothetical protein SAY86_002143 [Trapa natans]